MSRKRALITGVNGQDGSYLAELLLARDYEVFGLVRRVGLEAPEHRLGRLLPLLDRIQLQPASLESYAGIFNAVAKIRPDECYHLAAASFVSYEFDDEFSTLTTNINGTHYLLASLKDLVPQCRFYFAGTSEMFGSAAAAPQNEQTRFRPRSIYGISKVAGFELVRNYRERYGMHASSGILFNHESPRRGHEFVTRKITSGVARILSGQATELRLGNLDAERDWGYAKEYVEAMWLMLQQQVPEDFVIATGKLHTVRDFVRIAFACGGLDWEKYVITDPNFFRSGESVALCGDASKARDVLGWEPRKDFEEMIREMVETDCQAMGVPVPARITASS
jgi:GDPmannose 4,6-dehydratase